MQLGVGGRTRLDEARHAVAAAPVHPVQHQAVKVDVQVRSRAEALDERDGAAVAFVGLQAGALQQVPRHHALHHLQHRGDEFGLRGQQQAQRDRQRQDPLAHRHVRDDVIDQVRRGLRHPARATRRAEPAALAAEGQQFVVTALAASQPQEAVRQDAALEEGVELVLDESGQRRSCAGLGVGDEAGRVLLHQAVQRGLLGAVALVVDRGAIRRPLGLPADGLHARLPRW